MGRTGGVCPALAGGDIIHCPDSLLPLAGDIGIEEGREKRRERKTGRGGGGKEREGGKRGRRRERGERRQRGRTKNLSKRQGLGRDPLSLGKCP